MDASERIEGAFSAYGSGAAAGVLLDFSGAFFGGTETVSDVPGASGNSSRSRRALFDSSRVARSSTETRPTSTAFVPRLCM